MPLIVITGVSSGIGRASAEKFANEGWDVVGTVRAVPEAPIPGGPDAWSLEQLDLADSESVAALPARVLARYGCPDVILNNAAALQWGPVEHVSDEDTRRLFEVNVFSQLELIRAFVPCMRERGHGVIANVTSLGGRSTFPFFAIYNSSKWALEGVSEGLWHELKPFGIRVKAIEPGYVATPIYDKAMRDTSGEPIPQPEEYSTYMDAMREFERSITKRTPPEQAAGEVWDAVTDDSDRLRYPIAAYADQIVGARRVVGEQGVMRFFHQRWMGPESG